jgi:predicted amidophosphoribosyltransferase
MPCVIALTSGDLGFLIVVGLIFAVLASLWWMRLSRICPHCGSRIPREAKVCRDCGRELSEASDDSPA